MTVQEILARLKNVKKTQSGWVACCPAHDDKTPSLCVAESDGKILLNCQANCPVESVVSALGLEMADLFPPKDAPPSPKMAEVAHYDYTDERGSLLYQVVRYAPKTFRQRRKEGGTWVWDMRGVRRVPYRLPEVLKSEYVMIVEGEKDADTLARFGVCATCNVGGAGKWLDAYSEFFRGKSVVVAPDQDEAGRKHGEQVIKSLTGIAKVIALWNVDQGKDVSDWIAAQKENAKQALSDAIGGLKPLNLAPDVPIKSMDELEADYSEFVKQSNKTGVNLGSWIPGLARLRPLVPGEMAVIMADTGVGKTAILQNIAHAIWPLPVLLFEMELPGTLVFERFVQIGLGVAGETVESTYKSGNRYQWERNRLAHIFTCTSSKMNPKEMERIINASELRIGQRPAVIMVDYIGLLHCPGNSRYERMSHAAEQMKVLAKSTNTVFIVATQVHRREQEDGQELPVGIHDAKDSGSIENSAGLVLGAWRSGDGRSLKVKVLKSTKGGAGRLVECLFRGETLQIKEQAEQRDDVLLGFPSATA
jgi:5S rRNA maturation endonuclease (ribonuclease M5)